MVRLVVTTIPMPSVSEALGSRRAWGEAWWTARDICLANEPEQPDPIKALMDAYDRRLFRAFIHGE